MPNSAHDNAVTNMTYPLIKSIFISGLSDLDVTVIGMSEILCGDPGHRHYDYTQLWH